MTSWQPPGQPYTYVAPGYPPQGSGARSMSEIRADAAAAGDAREYYPRVHPPVHAPSYSAPALAHQGSFVHADGYTYVDQRGDVVTTRVVSRSEVLAQLRKPSTAISGDALQSGADASPHRASARSQRSSSAVTAAAGGRSGSGAVIAAARAQPSDSVLQQWLVPSHHTRYWALWTSLFTVVACFLFAFMAGNFGVYTQSPTFAAYNKGSSMPVQLQWGPQALLSWLRFWETSPLNSFDVGYMINWGARYMPAIAAGEWWRLFSSICLHGSFGHLASNMLVFVVLAVPLEHSYGPFRIFLIFMASGFGGTFMSMAFEDPCYVYVGASGAVFGFIGLYLADIILNFESMYRPLLRLAMMLISLGLTLAIEFASAARNPLQRVSHMSHIGGLVAGLVVSFMFLPNLADRRWKAARKLAGRISTNIHQRWSSHGGGGRGHSAASAPGGGGSIMEHQQSCWRRNAWLYYLMLLLCAGVILFLFAALPVYIYRFLMPSLKCAPLVAG